MELQSSEQDNEHRIRVTANDFERIEQTIELYGRGRFASACDALDAELGNAIVVDPHSISPNVVTMNSSVIFEDEASGHRREVTLVYPQAADPASGKVSILAPVGSALLGLSVGESIEWPLPGGKKRRFRIVKVAYQPEAAGDYEA